ncbi:MAG: hypothetical protein ACTSSJ_07235 [Candidatus Odinarchaeia archaeon]
MSLFRALRSELLRLRSAVASATVGDRPNIAGQVIERIKAFKPAVVEKQNIGNTETIPTFKPSTPILDVVKQKRPIRTTVSIVLNALPNMAVSYTSKKEEEEKKEKRKPLQSASIEAF